MIADVLALTITVLSVFAGLALYRLFRGAGAAWKFLTLGSAVASALLIGWDLLEMIDVIPWWMSDWRKVFNRTLDLAILGAPVVLTVLPQVRKKLNGTHGAGK